MNDTPKDRTHRFLGTDKWDINCILEQCDKVVFEYMYNPSLLKFKMCDLKKYKHEEDAKPYHPATDVYTKQPKDYSVPYWKGLLGRFGGQVISTGNQHNLAEIITNSLNCEKMDNWNKGYEPIEPILALVNITFFNGDEVVKTYQMWDESDYSNPEFIYHH